MPPKSPSWKSKGDWVDFYSEHPGSPSHGMAAKKEEINIPTQAEGAQPATSGGGGGQEQSEADILRQFNKEKASIERKHELEKKKRVAFRRQFAETIDDREKRSKKEAAVAYVALQRSESRLLERQRERGLVIKAGSFIGQV